MNRRLAASLAALPLIAVTALWTFTVTQSDCLTAPVNLTATSANGQVTLRWDPVPCARAYAVHRADGQLGSVTATSYTDRNVHAGSTQRYSVASIARETNVREGPASGSVEVQVR